MAVNLKLFVSSSVILLLNFGQNPIALRSWIRIPPTDISFLVVLHVGVVVGPFCSSQDIGAIALALVRVKFPFTLRSRWTSPGSNAAIKVVLHIEEVSWPALRSNQVSSIFLSGKLEVSLWSRISTDSSSSQIIFLQVEAIWAVVFLAPFTSHISIWHINIISTSIACWVSIAFIHHFHYVALGAIIRQIEITVRPFNC